MRNLKTKILLTTALGCFAIASIVFAQSSGFEEPKPVVDLPVPLTTSEAPQAIDSALGVGVTNDTDVPDGVSLLIQGNTITRNNNGVNPAVEAAVIVDATPTNDADGTTLAIQGDQLIAGNKTCPQSARVCVIEAGAAKPAISIIQETGVGLFGETSAAGKAGVYGEGQYGIYGYTTNQHAIGIVGQACSEAIGSPGTCVEYGTAGFFDGDVVVDPTKGYITGDGRNLYRVQSLFNLAEELAPNPTKGVAYKSFGVNAAVSVGAGATVNIPNVLGAGEIFTGMFVVERPVGGVFKPSDRIASYNEGTNTLQLTNATAGAVEVRIIVTYLLPS